VTADKGTRKAALRGFDACAGANVTGAQRAE
jgi:hypothetical protein